MNVATVHIDASVYPNPGPARIGYTIRTATGETLARVGQALTKMGNLGVNAAEYLALVAALRHSFRLGFDKVEVYTDSQVVANQLSGKYTAKNKHLARLLREVRDLSLAFEAVDVTWVPREKNTEADGLSHATVFEDVDLSEELDMESMRVPKLLGWQAIMVRKACKRGCPDNALARALNINSGTILQIRRGISYKFAQLDGRPDWSIDGALLTPNTFPEPVIFSTQAANENATLSGESGEEAAGPTGPDDVPLDVRG